ncbi:hypothetical protein PYW08_004164 [Mythimna loreyi]|uniref:Uncharacterized protein n=1 Tax=Mythimna loreyi TaxID=667449 RepID=A0ACC2QQ28_9NEOP|nr:hypothetical protein PYW08_004164 [Mythimna loreyi]
MLRLLAILCGRLQLRLEPEYPQSELPLRLYLRYYDTPPRFCPCLTAFDSELAAEESGTCSVVEEVDTGFEVFLAPDHGPQDDTIYTVSPEVTTVCAGEVAQWRVARAARGAEPVPDVTLLLRLLPVDDRGACWQRGEPAPLALRLRSAPRAPRLQLSCRHVRVRLCALHLPYHDVLRVRKRFHVMNVGSGVLELGVETTVPWSVLADADGGAWGGAEECGCDSRLAARSSRVPVRLEPRSSTEMRVEVCVSAAQVWPTGGAGAAAGGAGAAVGGAHCHAPGYPARTVSSTPLYIYDDDNILMTVPLVLELEFPQLRAAPPQLDLRVVADGDTRKCYFSVSHSSRTETLDLETEWIGGKEFKIWPPSLRIGPGGSANVYLQYTAVWQAAPVEGCACVRVCATCACEPTAARWCRTYVPVRATPARDFKFHVARHDHTDDPHLLPPGLEPGPPSGLPSGLPPSLPPGLPPGPPPGLQPTHAARDD